MQAIPQQKIYTTGEYYAAYRPYDNNTVYNSSACSSNCLHCNSTSCISCSRGYYVENGLCEGMDSRLSTAHSD